MVNCEKIKTERLELIPFSEKFISEKYVSWLNDPEIVRFSENRHLRHSLDSCRKYLKSFDNSPHCFWAIFTKRGNHIGNINAYVDKNNNIADVGIMIGELSEQGKGYAYEAWSAVVDYLLNTKNIRKVTAGTMALNLPMIKIMEKAGMEFDGTRPNHYLLDGKPVDLVHMALYKNI